MLPLCLQSQAMAQPRLLACVWLGFGSVSFGFPLLCLTAVPGPLDSVLLHVRGLWESHGEVRPGNT